MYVGGVLLCSIAWLRVLFYLSSFWQIDMSRFINFDANRLEHMNFIVLFCFYVHLVAVLYCIMQRG